MRKIQSSSICIIYSHTYLHLPTHLFNLENPFLRFLASGPDLLPQQSTFWRYSQSIEPSMVLRHMRYPFAIDLSVVAATLGILSRRRLLHHTLHSEVLLLINLTTLLSGRPLQLSSRVMARFHLSASVEPYLSFAYLTLHTFLAKSSLLDPPDQDSFTCLTHSWSRLGCSTLSWSSLGCSMDPMSYPPSNSLHWISTPSHLLLMLEHYHFCCHSRQT